MLPSNSPIVLQTLLCVTCSQQMRQEIKSTANGKLIGVVYFCDSEKCRYGFESQHYAVGSNIKHEPKKVAAPGGCLPPAAVPLAAPTPAVVPMVPAPALAVTPPAPPVPPDPATPPPAETGALAGSQ